MKEADEELSIDVIEGIMTYRDIQWVSSMRKMISEISDEITPEQLLSVVGFCVMLATKMTGESAEGK